MFNKIDYERYICGLFSIIFSGFGMCIPIISAMVSTIFLHKVEDMRAFDPLDYIEDKDTATLYNVGRVLTVVNVIWGITVISAILSYILVTNGVIDKLVNEVF